MSENVVPPDVPASALRELIAEWRAIANRMCQSNASEALSRAYDFDHCANALTRLVGPQDRENYGSGEQSPL